MLRSILIIFSISSIVLGKAAQLGDNQITPRYDNQRSNDLLKSETSEKSIFDCKWTKSPVFPETNFWGNAMSGNAMKQAATSSFSSLFLSNDGGQENIKEFSDFSTLGVAMSTNGRYITTTGQGINVSIDHGETWTNRSPDITFPVAMSRTGQYQTVCSFVEFDSKYRIHVSRNWGTTFDKHDISSDNPFVTANGMSGDGRIQIIGIHTNNSWISSDYGVTFQRHEFPSTKYSTVRGISLSYSGRFQVLGADSSLYASNDFGMSWREIYDNSIYHGAQYFYGSTITPNGQYMMATNASDYMISTDYGYNWNVGQKIEDANFLIWINLSDDAHKAMMTDMYGGSIYEGVCGWTTTIPIDVIIDTTAVVVVG